VAEEDAELALNGKPLPNDDDEAALLIREDEAALLRTELPPPLKLKAPPTDGIGKIGAEEDAELALNGKPLPNFTVACVVELAIALLQTW
jgi:hypothetical protein